jgi:hypothetical protein
MSEKPLYEEIFDFNQQLLETKKQKYKLILEFINKLSDKKFKSLTEFKNYNIDEIDMDQFEDVLEEYRYKLEGELLIDINNITIDITKILSDCLDSIGYSIYSKKKINEKTKETIILLTITSDSKNEMIKKIREQKKNETNI